MKTLTIKVPDSLDEAEARWAMAKALYEKGSLKFEQAASQAELAPTYFTMKLAGASTSVTPVVSHKPSEPYSPEQTRHIADKMDVQESWEELVAQIGK